MRAEQRICRTTDGRLVPEGDPDAAFLAYAVGDDISEADAERLKAADKPADKARKPQGNKSA